MDTRPHRGRLMRGPALIFERAALARALRMAGAQRGGMLRALRHPGFPFVFFCRNVVMIRMEPRFAALPPRLWHGLLSRMLRERSASFLAVERWLDTVRWLPGSAGAVAPLPRPDGVESLPEREGDYCSHCGACCETASGHPDFPGDSILPKRWKRLFGTGLGRGHRFCPFFRESADPPGSLCAVHPFRANPCRTFDREDCEFVMARLLPEHPFSPGGLDGARAGARSLLRSVRRRSPGDSNA